MASTLVIACGALARELRDIVAVNQLDFVNIEYLPAKLHNTPKDITAAVAARIERAETDLAGRGRVLVRYSGTEPLARVMVECEDAGRLEPLAEELCKEIDRLIGER